MIRLLVTNASATSESLTVTQLKSINPFHADDDSWASRPFVLALPMTTPVRIGLSS
jgi:hypothetical protein